MEDRERIGLKKVYHTLMPILMWRVYTIIRIAKTGRRYWGRSNSWFRNTGKILTAKIKVNIDFHKFKITTNYWLFPIL